MLEKEDRLKHKALQKKAPDQVSPENFKQPIHSILEKKVHHALEDPASDGESLDDEPLYDKITGDIYDE